MDVAVFDDGDGGDDDDEEAYILKVKKSADSTFQSKKICGKSA